MTEVLKILAEFSPLATVALALLIIFQLVKQKAGNKNISEIKENHLHEIKDCLLRIENKLNKLDIIETGIEVIKVKLNGKN